MCSLLCDNTFVQYHDLVCMLHRAQAMSNYHYCFVFKKCLKVINNNSLIVCIKAVSGFIKKNKFRIAINCTRYQYPLLLPHANTITFRANFCVEPKRQAFYKFINVGYHHSMAQLFHINLFAAYRYVLCDAVGKNKAFLHHCTAMAAPCSMADV